MTDAHRKRRTSRAALRARRGNHHERTTKRSRAHPGRGDRGHDRGRGNPLPRRRPDLPGRSPRRKPARRRDVEVAERGARYTGRWAHGTRHGAGSYRDREGGLYVGEYRDGERSGHGRFTWPKGRVYEGASTRARGAQACVTGKASRPTLTGANGAARGDGATSCPGTARPRVRPTQSANERDDTIALACRDAHINAAEKDSR